MHGKDKIIGFGILVLLVMMFFYLQHEKEVHEAEQFKQMNQQLMKEYQEAKTRVDDAQKRNEERNKEFEKEYEKRRAQIEQARNQ